MARGQLDVRLGDQVDEGPLAGRGMFVHGLDHLFVLVGTGNGENAGMGCADNVRFLAHAARHDHAAVLGNRFADGLQALFLGRIEEAAGVDQHDIRAGVIGAHRIAVGAQPG